MESGVTPPDILEVPLEILNIELCLILAQIASVHVAEFPLTPGESDGLDASKLGLHL